LPEGRNPELSTIDFGKRAFTNRENVSCRSEIIDVVIFSDAMQRYTKISTM